MNIHEANWLRGISALFNCKIKQDLHSKLKFDEDFICNHLMIS